MAPMGGIGDGSQRAIRLMWDSPMSTTLRGSPPGHAGAVTCQYQASSKQEPAPSRPIAVIVTWYGSGGSRFRAAME